MKLTKQIYKNLMQATYPKTSRIENLNNRLKTKYIFNKSSNTLTHKFRLNDTKYLPSFISTIVTIFTISLIMGCDPSETQLKEKAKQETINKLQSKVRNKFNDPISTQFRNIRFLSENNILCGEVNSKNKYGGYDEFKPFVANSNGDVIIFQAIPIVEIINLTKRTKEERNEYIKKYSLQFAALGQLEKYIEMTTDLKEMEEFNIGEFSLYGKCFTEK